MCISIRMIANTEKLELSLAPPLTKSVHIQTDYRDSETQTDPYSPEYVIRPGSQPELLTIASLCYGERERRECCIIIPTL